MAVLIPAEILSLKDVSLLLRPWAAFYSWICCKHLCDCSVIAQALACRLSLSSVLSFGVKPFSSQFPSQIFTTVTLATGRQN